MATKKKAAKKKAPKKKAVKRLATAGTHTKSKQADPCWDGYEKLGMKMKKGKMVPDCVPKKTSRKK